MTHVCIRDKITIVTSLNTKWKMDINCCHKVDFTNTNGQQ